MGVCVCVFASVFTNKSIAYVCVIVANGCKLMFFSLTFPFLSDIWNNWTNFIKKEFNLFRCECTVCSWCFNGSLGILFLLYFFFSFISIKTPILLIYLSLLILLLLMSVLRKPLLFWLLSFLLCSILNATFTTLQLIFSGINCCPLADVLLFLLLHFHSFFPVNVLLLLFGSIFFFFACVPL